jgi:hypothetical protein
MAFIMCAIGERLIEASDGAVRNSDFRFFIKAVYIFTTNAD